MLLAGVITPTIFNVETSVYPTSPTCTADTGAVLPLLLASPIEDAAAVETSITANALNASRPKTIRLIKTHSLLLERPPSGRATELGRGANSYCYGRKWG